MNSKSPWLLFCLFFAIPVSAQYQDMLHKPYGERAWEIELLYREIFNVRDDSAYVNRFAKKMKEWALEHNDSELALEAELLKADYKLFYYGRKEPHLKEPMQAVVEKAKKEGVFHIEERASYAMSAHYWREKEYEKAFEWALRLAGLLKKMTVRNFPDLAEHWNYIGRCHYFFKDYEKALIYLKIPSKISKNPYNAMAVSDSQNTLGLCYQKLGRLRSSDSVFMAIIKDTSKYAISAWKNIAKGNLGHNHFLRKEYDKAIPLLKENLAGALKRADFDLATAAAIPLAEIYLEQGRLMESKQKIDEARRYVDSSRENEVIRKWYPVASKWHAANNHPDSSAMFMDSTIAAIQRYNKKYSGLKLLRANQRTEEREKQLELAQLSAQSQLKLAQRNLWIVAVGILLLGSLLAYFFRNKYLLKKQQLKELALQNSQKKLVHAKNRLDLFIGRMRDDQKVIAQLQKRHDPEENQEVLQQLKTKNILTNEDWKEFKEMFMEVFPHFIPSLKKIHSGLTPAETRCLCLKKLGLSNNEMALLMGVAPNSVIAVKSRLRKKLGKENQKKLEKLIRDN
jgi:tetratricopeptide (TPR) repeat protein/DNA-binding CsgD family transcriptional regulator